jgi:hypothetical protein
MSAARTPRDKRNVNHGGLPPDDDLGAFAAAAEGAFGPPAAAGRPPLAAVPAPAPASAGEPAAREPQPAAPPAPAAQAAAAAAAPPVYQPPAGEPDDDDAEAIAPGNLIRQDTINVDANVAERFRRYQKREARTGPAPSNAEVVFRALDACEGRFREVVASRVPQPAPGRRFGGTPVPGRRVTSEARLTTQINYRPTYGEVAEIKRLQKESGARSKSAFLNAVLDDFLPPLKGAAGHSTQGQQGT